MLLIGSSVESRDVGRQVFVFYGELRGSFPVIVPSRAKQTTQNTRSNLEWLSQHTLGTKDNVEKQTTVSSLRISLLTLLDWHLFGDTVGVAS